jgi:hypothetical protein
VAKASKVNAVKRKEFPILGRSSASRARGNDRLMNAARGPRDFPLLEFRGRAAVVVD